MSKENVALSRQQLAKEVQMVLDQENDPELSCLEARHLVERNLMLPHDGLRHRQAAFIDIFQSCKAPAGSLSPGERWASCAASLQP